MEEEKTENQSPEIDIRRIFREKNPRLAPYIPGFIYSYLDRILHVDFLNQFLREHGDKRDLEFATASVTGFNITTEVTGLDELRGNGRFIFASNHPLGGFDGMILISLIGKKFPGIKTLANDILMNISHMHGVFVPINKHGKQSFEAVRKIESIYETDNPVLTFPSGLVSRRKRGIIRDLEWRKNFITKSKQHHRDVVPVWVSGRCTNFFYNLSNFRKFVGIKANLEMFYLPDETYRHRNEHIRVVFGKPIPWETFTSEKRPEQWANDVRELVYRLKDNPASDLKSDI